MKLSKALEEITPLPWETDPNYGLRILSEPARKENVEGHPDFTVAQCSTYCGQGMPTNHEEMKANARYLTHAANVLPLLVASLAYIKGHEDAKPRSQRDQEVWATVKLALQKAQEIAE